MITTVFVLFCCIVDGHSPANDFFGRWCSPLLGVTSLILTLFTALVTVWILAKLKQCSWNKISKMRSSQFKFVRVSTSTTPTSPSRSSRHSGNNWSKGKKTSPCILVRLGLDGTKKSDKHEAIEDGKAKTMMSRTSPSILVRLGLDKPKEEFQMDKGRAALIERTTVDQRIPLQGSSSFIKQNPYLWYLPTSARYPPVREPTGRLPPSSLLFCKACNNSRLSLKYYLKGSLLYAARSYGCACKSEHWAGSYMFSCVHNYWSFEPDLSPVSRAYLVQSTGEIRTLAATTV